MNIILIITITSYTHTPTKPKSHFNAITFIG